MRAMQVQRTAAPGVLRNARMEAEAEKAQNEKITFKCTKCGTKLGWATLEEAAAYFELSHYSCSVCGNGISKGD